MSIDQNTLEELEAKVKEFQAKGTMRYIINKFPPVGLPVEINGLQFRVTATNPKRGRLRLELEKP